MCPSMLLPPLLLFIEAGFYGQCGVAAIHESHEVYEAGHRDMTLLQIRSRGIFLPP